MTEEQGGLSWLGSHTGWWQVSREERYFCAELYRVVWGKEAKFVRFLNEKYGERLRENSNWELGYEVCFYRDWRKFTDSRDLDSELSMKRTFDLVLFSDAQVVVFEAKAHQHYDTEQLKDLKKDKENVAKCIKQRVVNPPEVLTAGIKSGRYKSKQVTLDRFDLRPLIDWRELAKWCAWDSAAGRVFERADCVYGR